MDASITGGAGFIGSNLARALVAAGRRVRVLDDLSTGAASNLDGLNGDVQLIRGDVRDADAVARAIAGADVVFHLAALPSVARSVQNPLASHLVNAEGTLSVLMAARAAGVRRVIYASSSSVYGDTPVLPKHEEMPVAPRSPYAASKLAGEAYCRAFAHSYGLETVALRFFNVFGPRQDPASDYAAVIPRFIARMLAGERPVVFGDGAQSRDFTFVGNAIQACLLAAEAGPEAMGEAVNVGCGARWTLLELVELLNEVVGTHLAPAFEDARPGDVRHSEASIDKATRLLGYRPLVDVREGLAQTAAWLSPIGAR